VLKFPAIHLVENSAMRKLVALILLLLSSAAAQAAEGHSHGVGHLNASLEGDVFSVELELPLESLLGFERAPKSAQDLARVRELATLLRSGDSLLLPSPAAGCALSGVSLASAAISPELLGEKATSAAAGASEQEHADLDAHYRFKCARPAELKRLEVAFFDTFKRLRVIEARLVTSKVQRAARLTGPSRGLVW
jgi:hypothetical protein